MHLGLGTTKFKRSNYLALPTLAHAHFSLFWSNIDVEYDQAKNKGSLYEETKAIYFKMFCLMYYFKKLNFCRL